MAGVSFWSRLGHRCDDDLASLGSLRTVNAWIPAPVKPHARDQSLPNRRRAFNQQPHWSARQGRQFLSRGPDPGCVRRLLSSRSSVGVGSGGSINGGRDEHRHHLVLGRLAGADNLGVFALAMTVYYLMLAVKTLITTPYIVFVGAASLEKSVASQYSRHALPKRGLGGMRRHHTRGGRVIVVFDPQGRQPRLRCRRFRTGVAALAALPNSDDAICLYTCK